MSNTSTVTPYDVDTSTSADGLAVGVAAACASGIVTGVIAAARWLTEETAEEKAMVEDLRKERRREAALPSASSQDLVSGLKLSSILSIDLHLSDAQSLVDTAEKLGYSIEKLSGSTSSDVLLKNASGERLALGRNQKGGVVVRTVGPKARIEALVRRHTVDRAVAHLSREGMRVQTARLANGEVQILGRTSAGTSHDESAEIRAQVRVDGSAWVDVERVQGSRCKEIVKEFAEAIGGEVSSSHLKDSFYELPGEPTKTRIKI